MFCTQPCGPRMRTCTWRRCGDIVVHRSVSSFPPRQSAVHAELPGDRERATLFPVPGGGTAQRETRPAALLMAQASYGADVHACTWAACVCVGCVRAGVPRARAGVATAAPAAAGAPGLAPARRPQARPLWPMRGTRGAGPATGTRACARTAARPAAGTARRRLAGAAARGSGPGTPGTGSLRRRDATRALRLLRAVRGDPGGRGTAPGHRLRLWGGAW